MTLDKKLVRLRKKEGLSQAEVSEKLDVSRQAVTKWETGASRPSTENLQALSKLYNVQLDYLLDEKEDELPVTAPVGPAAEYGLEQKAQEKRKRCIRRLLIGTSILVLICCIFLHVNKQEKSCMELGEMQGEDMVPNEVPEFNLYWE